MTTTELLNSAATIGHNHPELPKLTDAQKEAVDKAMKSLAESLKDYATAELDVIFVELDKAKKDVNAGPFRVLKYLKDKVPADKLALFPTPGSKAGETDVPDQYEEVYFRDGNKKFRKTSFYLKYFLLYMPEGKRIAATLQHIALAKDEKANHSVVPADIMALNPVDRETLREDLVSQQNNGVKALRDAVALIKQFDAVNALATVAAMPLMDKDGNIRRTSKPIKVWNTENAEVEWNVYSISGFMQFDPAKASELDGSYAALKLTAKREQGEDDPDAATADKPVVINTSATMVARLTDIHEFITNKLMADPKREAYGMFLKEHIAVAGSDDLIETLDDIRAFCAKVLAIPSVAARLEDIASKPERKAAAA